LKRENQIASDIIKPGIETIIIPNWIDRNENQSIYIQYLCYGVKRSKYFFILLS